MARKKLMLLVPDFPLPIRSGSNARVCHLSRAFSKHFEVTLMAVVRDDSYRSHLDDFRKLADHVVTIFPSNRKSAWHRFYYKIRFWIRKILQAETSDRFYNSIPDVNRAIDKELKQVTYDVLVATYWFWDWRIYDFPGLKVIDTNDVQTTRNQRLLQQSDSLLDKLMKRRLIDRYRKRESEALRRADVIVPITNGDAQEFTRMAGRELEQIVIPTGLDTDEFAPQGIQADPDHVAFFGALSNPMNVDAVRHLLADVFPLVQKEHTSAKLSLIGASPHPEVERRAAAHPNVRLTGYVADLRPALQEVAVVVLPLRFGYGIRGRVFELMSLAVPVVVTPAAIAGMDLQPGDGVLVEETPEGMARAILEILRRPDYRQELGRRGRQVAIERYSVAATYDRLAGYLAARVSQET